MSKPGILDPWRQAPPKTETVPAVRREISDGEATEQCVSFEDGKAGINVWVDAGYTDPKKWALMRLQALLTELQSLNDPAVTQALCARGIIGPATSALRTNDVALAIRKALVVSTKAAAVIAKHRVKAFIR